MTQGRRYRILGVLGQGGFGTVYRADLLGESGFTRQVALKVLNADMERVATVASRLRDEARLLGLLRHRAIIDVDGLVRLDGRWTVVMEYVEGADVGRILQRGPVPAGPALEILGEVAGALHVAYTRPGPSGDPLRLLHRDIKPPNVVVTPNGEVKVLDFGVARADFEGREAKTRAMLLGSVGYMAPERYDRIEGPEADVYALGVLLWEMITGDRYGRANPRRDRFEARHAEAVDRLSQVVLPEVVDFVDRMIRFDPAERPTAREVESRCRDLRLEVRGPWLRDWAEQVVTPLVPDPEDLGDHDFPSDVLTESGVAEADLEEPWPDRGGVAETFDAIDVSAHQGERASSATWVPFDDDEGGAPEPSSDAPAWGDDGPQTVSPAEPREARPDPAPPAEPRRRALLLGVVALVGVPVTVGALLVVAGLSVGLCGYALLGW